MIWAERTSGFRYGHTYTMAAPWYYHMTLRIVIVGRKINVERPVDKMDFRSPHITSYPFWPVAFGKYISYLFEKLFQSNYQSTITIISSDVLILLLNFVTHQFPFNQIRRKMNRECWIWKNLKMLAGINIWLLICLK